MPSFRQPSATSASVPLDREGLRPLAAEVLSPAHFYAGPGVRLEWEYQGSREISWEVFRGRLLDPAHTRMTQTFETWDVYRIDEAGRSTEPLLSLKLDWEGDKLHVVRGLLCYVWEGYDAGDNVILSRETTRWVRELAGTIDLQDFASVADLRDELVCRLFHAVVGASRLPLTSVEAPLPAFALGELAYFYHPGLPAASPGPMRSWRELLEGTRAAGLGRTEQAKLLETLLHAAPAEEIPALAAALRGQDLPPLLPLLRTLFNEVSLSPYTDLVDKALSLVDELERQQHATPAESVDFLGGLIRQLGRHLTAYDLITFHHRGANYPDALLLDATLKRLLGRIESHPALFLGPEDRQRWRRRALRQGWLLRRFYEGHAVPDAPTSPGENMRVLPPPHMRVSEEQILQPAKRTRRLFADDPLTNHLGPRGAEALRQSMADLHHPEELLELGMALFLDRPLGAGKAPGEPDQTILLSHLAFSRSVARQRLKLLDGATEYEGLLTAMAEGLRGVPVSAVAGRPRPGVVSAADARQVADDFLFLRTTAATATAFGEQYDLGGLVPAGPLLILPAAVGKGERLVIYDGEMRPTAFSDASQKRPPDASAKRR